MGHSVLGVTFLGYISTLNLCKEFVFLYKKMNITLFVYYCLFVRLSIYPWPICLFDYLSICLFLCLSICLFLCFSVCLFFCLSFCLFNCLSICLFVYLTVCLFVCFVYFSVCLFPYLSMASIIWTVFEVT